MIAVAGCRTPYRMCLGKMRNTMAMENKTAINMSKINDPHRGCYRPSKQLVMSVFNCFAYYIFVINSKLTPD